ncbi:MAG: hypothetical protein DWQ37_19480 [Planctomycetota bacterium]|nr:MAG: hypothetical protein DWQ37_19480 [Planctomycetota bacterium]
MAPKTRARAARNRHALGHLQAEPLEDRRLLSAMPVGPEFRVNDYTSGSQFAPDIAGDAAGNFVVAWQGEGPESPIWGIYLQRFDADGSPQGTAIRAETYTGLGSPPSVAMDADGDFVVTWAEVHSGGSDIMAQRFEPDGSSDGRFLVNTYTTNSQRQPSVAMDADGDFVVAWTSSYQDGDSYGIYAQRFDAAGAPQGGEFRANSYTTGGQRNPDVAMDADGEFVIAWDSDGQDGDAQGVFAQRYDASGNPVDFELQVNEYTTASQKNPSVILADDGRMTVVWESAGQDGDGLGIFGRWFYGSAGTSEFAVNTETTAGDQHLPVIHAAPRGFVVAWTQNGLLDGGIYAKRYSNAWYFSPFEPAFQVDSFTLYGQMAPAIAVDADGDFVVAWESVGQLENSQDGSFSGIYAQRFELTTEILGRHIYYNGSKFDGFSTAINASDDLAIAPDKSAYLPGSGPSTFANLTSYTRGINGIIVDIQDPAGTLTVNDFAFKMSTQIGANNMPSTWEAAPAPTAFSVRAGAGVSGSDRVHLVWANNAISNRWLEVIVEGDDALGEFNANTGLAESDRFYFGNRIGDTGTGTPLLAITSAQDEISGRNNYGFGASITNIHDFDRSGLAATVDIISARNNAGVLTYINLSDPPAAPALQSADASPAPLEPQGVPLATEILGRHIFYNESKFDGFSAGINASDDLAIAPDKSAYLPGSGPSTFANLTSYTRGINGIMIDIQDPAGTLTVDDFAFKMSTQVGANNTPSTWEAAPLPAGFSVRPGAGVSGSDRVEIIWANGAIANRWLEVIVEGDDALGGFNTNTGLAESDRFYFGNRIGDAGTGTPTLAVTSAQDEIAARNHPGFAIPITNVLDYDRNGLVASVDQISSRNNIGVLTYINLSDPPAAPTATDGESAAIAYALALEQSLDDSDADFDEPLFDLLALRD